MRDFRDFIAALLDDGPFILFLLLVVMGTLVLMFLARFLGATPSI